MLSPKIFPPLYLFVDNDTENAIDMLGLFKRRTIAEYFYRKSVDAQWSYLETIWVCKCTDDYWRWEHLYKGNKYKPAGSIYYEKKVELYIRKEMHDLTMALINQIISELAGSDTGMPVPLLDELLELLSTNYHVFNNVSITRIPMLSPWKAYNTNADMSCSGEVDKGNLGKYRIIQKLIDTNPILDVGEYQLEDVEFYPIEKEEDKYIFASTTGSLYHAAY